jgi:hypothetical protein
VGDAISIDEEGSYMVPGCVLTPYLALRCHTGHPRMAYRSRNRGGHCRLPINVPDDAARGTGGIRPAGEWRRMAWSRK